MSTSNELRVFISSTFRDLQEEREHLIKKIFPEIRVLCRKRGVTFTDIDLRWGLTEEEAMLGRVIRTCLKEVDKCRPYFIGMIGNRYGWVPEYHEILMDPDLLAKYPWIEEIALEGASVTEMEFIHGVFDAPQVDGEYAFFYHRSGNIAEADDPERLGALIERVRGTGKPFREFQSIEELGEQVRDDLVRMIEQHWPQSQAPSALELERRAHSAFAASRIRAYIPNPLYLKEFTGWLSSGTKPLVMQGESGLGKSSLVAYLTEYYRTKNPTALVIEHYVGASQASGSALAVMRHIIEEIGARFGIDETLPAKEEELEKSFANWLYRCEHLATQAGVAVMIVIDAVNQLGESGRRLSWLPKTIPTGVNLLVSTTPGEAEDRLMEREWDGLLVRPLEDEEVRQSIVVRYLGEFHKGITPEQVRRVTGDAKGSSPLYLRVVTEELRLHGEHETIDEMISRYTEAEGLLEVFDRVLERFEHDYGAAPLRELMSLIWTSRAGLSELNILEITGLSRLELSRLLFAIDYHFVQREGLLGFFHDYLRRAVDKRYLPDADAERRVRLRLAEYFQTGLNNSIAATGFVPHRMADELAYQLHASEAWDQLQECLTTIPVFRTLYEDDTLYDVLSYWKALSPGRDIETAYRLGLERWRTEDAAERCSTLGRVADLLQMVGGWDGATALQRERLALAVDGGIKIEEASACERLSVLYRMRGNYVEALQESERSRDLFVALGDRGGLIRALNDIGATCYFRGDYDRALEAYLECERTSREMGDVTGIAGVLHNSAVIYAYQGRLAEALQLYKQALEINRSTGRRVWIANNFNGMGIAYANLGEYDQALECHEQERSMFEALGDPAAVASAIGNMGNIYLRLGEFDRAIECFKQALSMGEELGDRNAVATMLGNMGYVYLERGEYDQALEHLTHATGQHRILGSRQPLSHWLGGTARALIGIAAVEVNMPDYLPKYVPDAAPPAWRSAAFMSGRVAAVECVAIAEDLQMSGMIFLGNVQLVRIDAAEGNLEHASMKLREMLVEATDDVQRAECHYWLWKLRRMEDRGQRREENRAEALRLYQTLVARTPKHAYRMYAEELTADTNPPETTDAPE